MVDILVFIIIVLAILVVIQFIALWRLREELRKLREKQ
jgi:hypothetical protein